MQKSGKIRIFFPLLFKVIIHDEESMKRYVVCFFLLSLFLPLFAQSNDVIDSVLSEKSLSAGSAAYILLSIDQSGDLGKDDAFEALRGKFDLAKYGVDSVSDEVSLGLFAYLLQQELDLPRGIGSFIFAGPRYAVRDLRFLGILQTRGDAKSSISGEEALSLTGRALTELEERS